MKTVVLAVLLFLAVASIVSGYTTVLPIVSGDTTVAPIGSENSTETGK
jgi:hypothetical protein